MATFDGFSVPSGSSKTRYPLLHDFLVALDRIECAKVFATDGLGAGIRPLDVLTRVSGGSVRLKQRRIHLRRLFYEVIKRRGAGIAGATHRGQPSALKIWTMRLPSTHLDSNALVEMVTEQIAPGRCPPAILQRDGKAFDYRTALRCARLGVVWA
jgi:hypothetical protein